VYIKLLKYYIFIILIFIINIWITYSYILNNKIKNKTLKKKEVLKIKNNVNLSYYCKNNICVVDVNHEALGQFVEISDENGNIKIYIIKSYRYDDELKSTKLLYKISGGHDIIVPYKCTSESLYFILFYYILFYFFLFYFNLKKKYCLLVSINIQIK